MRSEQQFEQLMLQYDSLINSAKEIKIMIENEDFDNAITQIKSREAIFLNCKCIRKFLELSSSQEKILNETLDNLRVLEQENIELLQNRMSEVKKQLRFSQQNEKFQSAYKSGELQKGNIINVSDTND